MRKFYAVFLLLVITAVGLAYLFKAGWHPVALVNSKLVWAWVFEKEYRAATQYYGQALDVYKVDKLDQSQLSGFRENLKQAALEKIIEKIIISQNLNKIAGQNGLDLVREKINKYAENSKLQAAANTLFELSFQDFEDLVLVPQAEREILEEKLAEEGRDFNAWLASQKKQAKVYIFIKNFTWTGTEIKKSP